MFDISSWIFVRMQIVKKFLHKDSTNWLFQVLGIKWMMPLMLGDSIVCFLSTKQLHFSLLGGHHRFKSWSFRLCLWHKIVHDHKKCNAISPSDPMSEWIHDTIDVKPLKNGRFSSRDHWWYLLRRHMINTLWLSHVDKAVPYSVLSWLQRVSRWQLSLLRFVHPFDQLVELSQVSRSHFSPLNGFNCPDDLNQKTITKGKRSTGNYCVQHEIEHTWMELAPFTVVKLHVQPVMAVVMKKWAWSMCLKCLCVLREVWIWDSTDTSKPHAQGATL